MNVDSLLMEEDHQYVKNLEVQPNLTLKRPGEVEMPKRSGKKAKLTKATGPAEDIAQYLPVTTTIASTINDFDLQLLTDQISSTAPSSTYCASPQLLDSQPDLRPLHSSTSISSSLAASFSLLDDTVVGWMIQ